MKQARAKVYKLAVKLKASVWNSPTDIEVEAPDNWCWNCEGGTGLHVLVASQWDDEPIVNLWNDLYERMAYGVQVCDCDHCQLAQELAVAEDV